MKVFATTDNEYKVLKQINMNERYRVFCSLMNKHWRDYEVQFKIDTFMVMRYKLINTCWIAENTLFVDGKLL